MSIFKNWTDYHHRLNLIFHGIVAVTMIPFVWLYLEIDTGRRTELLNDPVILILFLLVSLSLIITSFLYKKKQLLEAQTKPDLRSKLAFYYRTLIVTYLLMEVAAVFATLAFFITANYLFVITYIVTLFVFSVYRPKAESAIRDLNLTDQEKNILINRTEIQ